MNALIVGRNQRAAQIKRLGLRGSSERVASIFAAVELQIGASELIEATVTRFLQNLPFDPAMSAVFNALLFGPLASSWRGAGQRVLYP